MSSRSMLYVGTYPQIYPPTILRLGIVSRDGLPRGTLPSGILKLEKYCPGLKVRHPLRPVSAYFFTLMGRYFGP